MDIKTIIKENLTDAYKKCGFNVDPVISYSNKPELCDFQNNNAFQLAKELHVNPLEIAKKVVDNMAESELYTTSFVAPAFINFSLTNKGFSLIANELNRDKNLGVITNMYHDTVIMDYGGANVAKELHIGHLRSAIVGEGLARLYKLLGNKVISDTHLGDWGLQMGLTVAELEEEGYLEGFFGRGENKTISLDTLNEVYPKASIKKSNNKAFKEKAEQYTLNIQNHIEPYFSIYKHIKEISVKQIKHNYDVLGCHFDLWYGESDAEPYVNKAVEIFERKHLAKESDGATIVEVANENENLPTDKFDENGKMLFKNPMPPLILKKHNGADVYATSEIATILLRNEKFNPDKIVYFTDFRQITHFKQVFRACKMADISPKNQELIHIIFGTINGKDGKAFKTRSGEVVKLEDIINLVTSKAEEKLLQNGIENNKDLALKIGLAAMKFGDLSNVVSKDYIFDMDKFASFEGKTGPYIQYTGVRIKSILNKANFDKDKEIFISLSEEKKIIIQLLKLIDSYDICYKNNSLNTLCMNLYDLCASFSVFYNNIKILSEKDEERKSSYLSLSLLVLKSITMACNVLGIDIPERM